MSKKLNLVLTSCAIGLFVFCKGTTERESKRTNWFKTELKHLQKYRHRNNQLNNKNVVQTHMDSWYWCLLFLFYFYFFLAFMPHAELRLKVRNWFLFMYYYYYYSIKSKPLNPLDYRLTCKTRTIISWTICHIPQRLLGWTKLNSSKTFTESIQIYESDLQKLGKDFWICHHCKSKIWNLAKLDFEVLPTCLVFSAVCCEQSVLCWGLKNELFVLYWTVFLFWCLDTVASLMQLKSVSSTDLNTAFVWGKQVELTGPSSLSGYSFLWQKHIYRCSLQQTVHGSPGRCRSSLLEHASIRLIKVDVVHWNCGHRPAFDFLCSCIFLLS